MSNFISLSIASQMTAEYRQNRNSILETGYQHQNILPVCETFLKADIEAILNQQGCVKFRLYYGMDANLKVHAIFVGVNEADEDIIPAGENSMVEETEDGLILEAGVRCPEICPPASPLNE